MSPMCLNAGDVTVSFAPPLAGSVRSADAARPTSFSLGGACAEANVGASRMAVHVMMSARSVIDGSPFLVNARLAFATHQDTQKRVLARQSIKTSSHSAAEVVEDDTSREIAQSEGGIMCALS